MEQFRIGGRAAGAVLRGLLLAFLVTVVFLLLIAFVFLKMQPDMGKTEIGILLTYVLSCFAGGWYCGRRMERKKFLWGLLVGVLYFLLLLAVSGMSERSLQSGLLQSLTAFVLCAGGGMFGGMVAS